MTDKDRLWHMWRRYYDLPVKVHALRSGFVFRRGNAVQADRTLQGILDRISVTLEREGVKPFSEFGVSKSLRRSQDAESIG